MLPQGPEWDSDSAGERAAVRAPVTPRVHAPHTGEPLPLADCIQRLIDRKVKGIVCLHGPPGSGKTTALRHLKAVLPEEICPHVVDGPASEERLLGLNGLTIFTDHSPASLKNAVQFQMAAWSQDDCIEYLLAAHPTRCASVMSRIRSLPNPQMLDGRPELWRILLDAFAHDESIIDPAVALRMAAAPLLTLHGGPIGLFCLESLCQGHDLSDHPELSLPTRAGRLVRHRPVQLVLAADRIVEQLCDRRGVEDLTSVLPDDLIAEVARLAAFWPTAVEQIETLIKREVQLAQPMAVSIQVAVDKGWRPAKRLRNLSSAVLRGAAWQRADLSGALLRKAQFTGADLRYAKLRFAQAEGANFSGAKLRFAILRKLDADAADFSGADLSHARAKRMKANGATFDGARLNAATFTRADLRGSGMCGAHFVGAQLSLVNLTRCDLKDADFTDADLRRVLMDDCDLSVATFDRARFCGSSLRNCNLSGMQLRNADFSGAVLASSDLTGAVMPRANFEGAVLCNAGLAEVDWEGANLRYADLQSASFHLGSTRSGLVGSNVPCEGSRTGFYTDDFDEQEYRPAEEIRKANLRGADLRGANIEGVDFYLVDLRNARYTADQREQFRACRAILYDRQDE